MTYSAAVLDEASGQLVVGVQSCHPAVGAVVPHVRDGVGAVLTQARGEPRLATALLDEMGEGRSPGRALELVLASDAQRAERQLAVLAEDGRSAAFTGDCCVGYAAHVTGHGFVVATNLAATAQVVEGMVQAVRRPGSALERVLRALDAAQDAGGDLRGLLSAALVVGAPSRPGGCGRLEARIDVSDAPLRDLQRAVNELRAFQIVADAARCADGEDVAGLVAEVRSWTSDPQTLFWFALDVLAGRLRDVPAAAELMAEVVARDRGWADVLARMPSDVARDVRAALVR